MLKQRQTSGWGWEELLLTHSPDFSTTCLLNIQFLEFRDEHSPACIAQDSRDSVCQALPKPSPPPPYLQPQIHRNDQNLNFEPFSMFSIFSLYFLYICYIFFIFASWQLSVPIAKECALLGRYRPNKPTRAKCECFWTKWGVLRSGCPAKCEHCEPCEESEHRENWLIPPKIRK